MAVRLRRWQLTAKEKDCVVCHTCHNYYVLAVKEAIGQHAMSETTILNKYKCKCTMEQELQRIQQENDVKRAR